MKRILCIGSYLPNEIEEKSSYVSSAGNRFQNNFWSHLKQNETELIGCSYIGTPYEIAFNNIAPKCYSSIFSEHKFVFKRKGKIKAIWEMHTAIKAGLEKCNNAICYNIDYTTLIVPYMAKLRGVKTVLILADYSGKETYTNFFYRVYARLQKIVIGQFDAIICLSEGAKEIIHSKQENVLMEGGIEPAVYDRFECYEKHSKNKTVMYSGLLSEVTGIDTLLDVIKQCNRKDVRFVITGKGPYEKEIRLLAETDNRINFLGNLSYEEYLNQLNYADILINPRNMTLPENAYNFPSKIMDYLASGKLIISTRFYGWRKYDDVIRFTDSDSYSIARALNDEIDKKDCNNVYRREFAKNFLWDNQIKKVLALLQ